MRALPPRPGPRPRTSRTIPHRQLDQQPDDSRLTDALLAVAATWPGVAAQESDISVAGARALVLDPEHGGGAGAAFMTGREFCHGHSQGDHSLHATLPVDLAAAAHAAGWAEPHFLVHTGRLAPTVVMLYAPRDEADSEVLLDLVRASYRFATGEPADPAAAATRPSLEPTS